MTVAVKGIVASLVVVFLQDHGHAYDDIAWQLKKCPRINLPNLQELTLARHRHKEKNCLMYSHVEYFNYSLHALRTITLYSARVYSCVYKTMCYFESRYATDLYCAAACGGPEWRVRHTWSDRAWYTSSL
jgi:hypothetical protein